VSAGGAVIVIGGLGLAVFLYLRSQQQQQAALAAAAGAPGPGFLQKAENTLKPIVKGAPQTVANVATTPVGVVKSIFGGGSSISFDELKRRALSGRI
jgi:hypothetical protein